jgi:hypothetical protein
MNGRWMWKMDFCVALGASDVAICTAIDPLSEFFFSFRRAKEVWSLSMLINNDVLQLIRRPVIRFETFTSLLLLAGV